MSVLSISLVLGRNAPGLQIIFILHFSVIKIDYCLINLSVDAVEEPVRILRIRLQLANVVRLDLEL